MRKNDSTALVQVPVQAVSEDGQGKCYELQHLLEFVESDASPRPATQGWQKRWFVLDDAVLSYYKEKDARTMFQARSDPLPGPETAVFGC